MPIRFAGLTATIICLAAITPIATPAVAVHIDARQLEAATDRAAPAIQRVRNKCGRRSIYLEGRCVLRREAESFCGPGFKVQGERCVSRYQSDAEKHGCPPGLVWSAQEGCHEDD